MTDAHQKTTFVEDDSGLDTETETPIARWNLDAIVSELRFSREVSHNIRPKGILRQSPSRDALSRILDDLAAGLFPTHYGQSELRRENIDYFVGDTLNRALVTLVKQVHRSFLFSGDVRNNSDVYRDALSLVTEFAADLPAIRGLLVGDVRAAYQGDPAATDLYEILLGYPGTTAIIYHRLANSLYRRGAPLVARLISDIGRSKTGIDIHPGADVGPIFLSITAPASSSVKRQSSANACAFIKRLRSAREAFRSTTTER
jgi:serine O-acetyltransferase